MTKVASEDSVRRAMTAMEEQASEGWMKKHLQASYEPLLEEPWALDMDTNRSCGRCWTGCRSRAVRRFCAGIVIGERSERWRERSSARWPTCSN